jgi:hypothetical protein
VRRIYKWPLEVGSTALPWSSGDRVLLVADQRGTLTLWAEQEDGNPAPQRWFTVVGTGFDAPAAEHVGSAICGDFVWHVYAATIESPPATRGKVPDA